MKSIKPSSLALAAALSLPFAPAIAQVMVDGAPMLASKDIVYNAVNSKDHTTLVAAVKAAGLVDETGHSAVVTIADVLQSNGVIHVVDQVLLPN